MQLSQPSPYLASHILIVFGFFFFFNICFLGGSAGKESACNVGDLGLSPTLGRSPGGGHGNPLQYSCLKNPVDKGT